MFSRGIPNEYQTRINAAVNYILQNLAEDLSLQQLAKVADYSPFHFQKIFKQVTGESPKQYVIRIRLETAGHALVMHRHRTVTEIALENGFSSSATFARSFKSHFGVSAEEFRAHPRSKNAGRYQEKTSIRNQSPTVGEIDACLKSLNIRVVKRRAFRGVFINAKLHDQESVQNAFRKIAQIAETHDLLTPDSQFAGAVYLHSGIYRAILMTNDKLQIPKRLNVLEIPSGKYAVLDLAGNFLTEMAKLQIFVDSWVPENGYRIADIVGYEMLSDNPLEKPYPEIKKEIYIPIEPAV